MKRIEKLFSALSLEANQTKKQRLFGSIATALLLLAFAFSIWKKQQTIWPLMSIGAMILIVTIYLPKLLKFPLLIWLLIGKILGEISSRIILAVLYLLVAFPISLFRKKKSGGGWEEKKIEENDYEKMY